MRFSKLLVFGLVGILVLAGCVPQPEDSPDDTGSEQRVTDTDQPNSSGPSAGSPTKDDAPTDTKPISRTGIDADIDVMLGSAPDESGEFDNEVSDSNALSDDSDALSSFGQTYDDTL
jgi:hypothetical protein